MEKKFKKRTIKREKPNKKWSLKEINDVLNYMLDVPEIEIPTAQIFYKKLIAETAIDAPWELIRWKVRHLKTTYKKASDWRNTTGAGLLESDVGADSVEGKLLQICPHYYKLHQIFGVKRDTAYDFVDTGEPVVMSEPETNVAEICDSFESDIIVYDGPVNVGNEAEICATSDSVAESTSNRNLQDLIPQKGKDFAEKLKKNSPRTPEAHLATFQAERTAMFKMKIEWEKEKQSKEIEMEERRLQLQEEKINADIELKKREIDLKELEIEKEIRMKKMELENEKLIKTFEIEMKYKHENKL